MAIKKSGITALLLGLMLSATVLAQSVESLMNQGLELLRNGAWSQAATQFRKVLAQDGSYFEAQHNLAFALLQMGRYGDAVTEFKKAIALNGRSAEAWSNMAVAYEGLGQSEKALDALTNSVNLDGDNLEARMNLATLFANQNKYPRAIAQYREIVRIDGSIIGAYLNLARCLVNTEDYAGAKRALGEAINTNPQSADAHYELALILWKRDKSQDEALKAFNRAIALNATSPEFYNSMAQLLTEMQRPQEAIAAYRTMLNYVNDALQKEQINDRIVRLERGDKVDSPASGSAFGDGSMQTLQRDGVDGRSQPVKTVKSMDIDITNSFESLNQPEPPKPQLDLQEELRKRAEAEAQ